jgi:hypothetical protein
VEVAYILRVVVVGMGGRVYSSSSNALERWKMGKVKKIWLCIYTFCPPAGEAL